MTPLTERERAFFGPRTDKPPGSPAWCWQTILLMQNRWKQKTLDEAGFHGYVEELRAYEAWNVVPPEAPYGSLEALLEAEIGCGEQEAKRQLVAQATGSTGGRPIGERSNLDLSTQRERAAKNGVSKYTQIKLDYLAGHAPDLLAAVQAGTVSTHRAYHLAKGTPPETPLTTLHRVWRKVDPADRLRFLIEMLTPAERRALLSEEETP